MAPLLLGGGRGWVAWPGLQSVDQGLRMSVREATQVGADLRLRLAPANAADFKPLPQPASVIFTAGLPST
jgi:hypothetical protein